MSTKRKLPAKLGQPVVKPSAKVLGKGYLNESKTVASGGDNPIKSSVNGFKKGEVVDISSDSSSAEEDSADESDGGAGGEDIAAAEDVAMGDAVAEQDGEEPVEPSFGDLVRANASEPIDVAAAFDVEPSGAISYPGGAQIQTPSGASLGTVLTQALKTNDVALLESCLQTNDIKTIRATIQRLDSRLAGTLLHKLAERLHRRPGRSGSLLVWVQWTLVTHGGFLATQPDLIKKIAELNRVIDDRSKALQNLLSVKGKLDMLDAQIELRKGMQRAQRGLEDEEDDEGVIYVEGEESDEEIAVNGNLQRPARNGDDVSDRGSEDSEDMPLTNGMIADSEDEDEDSEEGDLIDDEAIETDAESGDEDEVDHDDEDSQREVSESDEETSTAPPKKVSRLGGLFSRGKK